MKNDAVSRPGGPSGESGPVLAVADHVDDLRRLDALEGGQEQGKALAAFEAPAQEEAFARARRSDRSRREEVGAHAVGNHLDLLLRPGASDQRGRNDEGAHTLPARRSVRRRRGRAKACQSWKRSGLKPGTSEPWAVRTRAAFPRDERATASAIHPSGTRPWA